MSGDGKSHDELAREANQVRTKLLRTVEQLDARRHDAFDLRSQLDRHLKQLAVAGGVLVLATAGAVALAVHGVQRAAERRRRDRWKLARHLWRHPERAMRAERRSLVGELGRSVLLSVLSAAVAIPVRRAVAMVAKRVAKRIVAPEAPAPLAPTDPPTR